MPSIDGRTVARNLRTIFAITSIFQIFLVILHSERGDSDVALVWAVFAGISLLIAATLTSIFRLQKRARMLEPERVFLILRKK